MNGLSLFLYVRNSKEFATVIKAEVVSGGQTIETHEARLFETISKANQKKMAEEIKTNIQRNLDKGLKYTGGKVAPLAVATIEAKKRKGRLEPSRVFVDSGVLIKSLRISPTGTGYVISFQKYKYPKTKVYVNEVAQWLNEGSKRMPARPFFGITKNQFESLVNKYASKRRINVEVSQAQIERAGELVSLITGQNPLMVNVLKQPAGQLLRDINLDELYQRSLGQ